MGIFLLRATWAHEFMATFFKLTGIARRGVLKELEVCDFDKTWSACQRDDDSCVNVNMVTKYNSLLWSAPHRSHAPVRLPSECRAH